MKKFLFAGAFVMLGMALMIGTSEGQDAKYTMKEIMAKAMKGGLAKKVAEGKASDAEKMEVVAMFESMHKFTPKKGDAAQWKVRVDTLIASAKAGDKQALLTAINCSNCHSEFKGK